MIKYGKTVSIKEYFSTNSSRILVVPDWQREYSWKSTEAGQVGTLIADIKEFLSRDDLKNKEYFLGNVILCESKNEDEFIIIDGQQRTITLLLFLMAVRKYIKIENLQPADGEPYYHVIHEVRNCLTNGTDGSYSKKIAMNQKNADNIIEEIFNWSHSNQDVGEAIFKSYETQTPTQRNIISSVSYMYKELLNQRLLSENKVENNKKFLEKIDNILTKIKMIEIMVDNEREAIEIYDHINDRGMPLSGADIVKNKIFKNASDNDFEIISKNWQEMQKNLNSIDNQTVRDAKFLLKCKSIIESGQKITYSALPEFYEKIMIEGDQDSKLDPKDLSAEFLEVSKKILYLYENLYTKANKELKSSELDFASSLGSVQHYPALLASLEIKDEITKNYVQEQICKRVVIYNLTGERSQDFETLIPKWAHEINKFKEKMNLELADEIYNKIENLKVGEEKIKMIEDRIENLTYMSPSDRRLMRILLTRVSYVLEKNADKNLDYHNFIKEGAKNHLDIEHIAPKSNKKIKDSDKIGNLTLLHYSDNRSQKDIAPEEKKKNYEQSKLILTKLLAGEDTLTDANKRKIKNYLNSIVIPEENLQNWNSESIEKRGKFIINIVKKDLLSHNNSSI